MTMSLTLLNLSGNCFFLRNILVIFKITNLITISIYSLNPKYYKRLKQTISKASQYFNKKCNKQM